MSIIEILQQIFSATEEQTNSFSAAMKANGIYTTSHENMDVRYPKLKGDFDSLNTKYGDAQKRIGDMEKASQGQGDLQGEVDRLKAELEHEKIKSAVKVGLLSEKAKDVDYLAYLLDKQMKEEGKTMVVDDNGDIKGWKDLVDGLKTQKPDLFESAGEGSDGYQVYKPNTLRKPDGDATITKEAFNKMSFQEKVELNAKNPTLYKQLRGN